MIERNEAFEEMLDDIYEPYNIGSMKFYASAVLRECDPVAYRIGVSEFDEDEEEE